MIIEIKIPSPGESITEVELANWFVENGDSVSKDQEVGEIESEKATLPLIAEQGGKIEILISAGETVNVGTVACKIDTSAEGTPVESQSKDAEKEEKDTKPEEETKESESITPNSEKEAHKSANSSSVSKENSKAKITPLARKKMEELNLNVDDIIQGLRKISTSDVEAAVSGLSQSVSDNFSTGEASREVESNKMSQLRKKISERLVSVKNETAMLTTFNEADMSSIMALRKTYQEKFIEKHDVKLGFMSFFTKAASLALQKYPNVNSFLEGDQIISPKYTDIGIAVQTDKGLMVPILRNVEILSLADIEKQILDIAGRARKNRISMDELAGGTFTITNGGIFGSMLSTPILNPPQSGILGMHNILDRPVAVNGKVEIRPMMYLALSYDHRVIDGRDSVGFLKTLKEYIENPASMLFSGSSAEETVLGL